MGKSGSPNSDEESRKRPVGRPPAIQGEDLEELLEVVKEMPVCTLAELNAEFRRRSGVEVRDETIRRTLKRAGYSRVVPSRSKRKDVEKIEESNTPEPGEKRYGYTKLHRRDSDERRYPSSLTDAEWALLAPVFDNAKTGRPPKYPRRDVLDGIFYILRSGAPWRMLPKDFPPWKTVYETFKRWVDAGKMEKAYSILRAMWREREGRRPEPTGAVIDSQSVKTSDQGGPKGYDAGKKVKGRKRHIVTDTLGLLLAILVHTADIQDRDGAIPTMAAAMERHPTIEQLWVDTAYAGQAAAALEREHGIRVRVVRRADDAAVGRWTGPQLPLPGFSVGFQPLPKRWLVERSISWHSRPRRMAKDHDRNPRVSEAWIWLAHTGLLLRRLGQQEELEVA